METEQHKPRLPLYKQKLDIAQPDAAQMLDSATLTASDYSYGFQYHISWFLYSPLFSQYFCQSKSVNHWHVLSFPIFVFSAMVGPNGSDWLILSGYICILATCCISKSNKANILYVLFLFWYLFYWDTSMTVTTLVHNKWKTLVLSLFCLHKWMKGYLQWVQNSVVWTVRSIHNNVPYGVQMN